VSLVAWMFYAVVVGLLLAAAAWCLERALGRLALPTRWVWGGALLLSVGIPVGGLIPGPSPGDPAGAEVGRLVPADRAPEVAEGTRLQLSILRGPAALAERGTDWVNRVVQGGANAFPTRAGVIQGLLALWLAITVALAGTLLLAGGLLARRRSRWPRAEVLGRRVRLAPALGPAVVGVVRPEIVLPPWALTLTPEELELVLAHEEEHLRARDPLLLAGGILPAVLLPWNPGLWWIFRRLRDAVEVDCDRRVLRRGILAKRYGALLLRLGARAQTRFLPVAALRPSRPLLHRRLHAMNTKTTRGRLPVALLAALTGLGFLALACDADTPLPPDVPAPPAQDAAEVQPVPEPPVSAQADTPGAPEDPGAAPQEPSPADPRASAPTFTPFEVAPEVTNRTVVQRALEREYPPLLRDAGIGGTTIIHFFITEDGEVGNALIAEPSGHSAVDAAALRVATEFRFTPARLRDSAVPVWVQIPITFTTR